MSFQFAFRAKSMRKKQTHFLEQTPFASRIRKEPDKLQASSSFFVAVERSHGYNAITKSSTVGRIA
jgi:hypothetical protein